MPGHDAEAGRRRRNVISALVLALVALGFYVAFFLVMGNS